MAYIFCKHNWSKWSELIICYTAPYQFAYCKKCNKIVSRRHSLTTNEVNTNLWNHQPNEVQQNEETT